MAARYEDAPEVTPHVYPEAVPTPPPPQQHQQLHQQSYYSPPQKYEHPAAIASPPSTTAYTAAGSTTGFAPSHLAGYGAENGGASGADRKRGGSGGRTVCGCTLIVFVLSVIIAVLAAGVIGLAAGTGIEASRANDANDRLQRLQSSVSAGLVATATTGTAATTTSSGTATATATIIDNGCADNPSAVNGQSYTSFKLLSLVTYTMRCNQDVNGTVLYSLFSPDFNTCMDSCSGYTKYATQFFGQSNINATCAGVSFIPLWTDKSIALQGGAPGNCYLKKGPLENKAFVTANAGTPVHGAIVSGT